MSRSADEPRFLHRSAARNYTSNPALAARGEPEAVSEAEQASFTRAARERERRSRAADWGEARSSIVDGVERFKSSGRLDRKLAQDLRLVERGVRALDRDVLGP